MGLRLRPAATFMEGLEQGPLGLINRVRRTLVAGELVLQRSLVALVAVVLGVICPAR